MLDYTLKSSGRGAQSGKVRGVDLSSEFSEDQNICCIPHCERERTSRVSIHLCEHHIEKAWAAYHVINEADMPELENIERDMYSPNARGTLYVIRVGDLIKIGWTANPRERMYQLQPDAVLHYQQGTRQDEANLHAQCEKYLVKGREWYRDSPGMKQIIEDLQVGKAA